METDNKLNADYMLRSALHRTESPSSELLTKIRYSTIKERPVLQAYHRSRRLAVAAIVAVTLLTVSTVALAYTGVLSSVFSAITNGSDSNSGIGNDTRRAIVEHGYVSEIDPSISVSDSGEILELKAYYADAKELWFNFTLSNATVPDNWDLINVHYFYLEMVNSRGDVDIWELQIDSSEMFMIEGMGETTNYIMEKSFPGGYNYYDQLRGISIYEPDDGKDQDSILSRDNLDFQVFATGAYTNDGTFEITVIVFFNNANAPIGEKALLKIGNFNFIDHGDITDDNAVLQNTLLESVWEYTIDIESRYADTAALTYNVINVDEAAQYGITIHNVTVLPSVCRVEASIDYAKNKLANPENVSMADSSQMLGKLDLFNTGLHATADGKVYGGMTSAYTEVNGRVVDCWFEFGSMYFDAPETFTLVFTGYDGNEIHILVTLER